MGNSRGSAAAAAGSAASAAGRDRKKKRADVRSWMHVQNWTLYGWVLAGTALMLTVLFALEQVYPFGDTVLRYSDGDMYLGFLGYVQSTLQTDNNLLYSWSSVLGNNMMGTWAFYCASPFNLLVVFFPDNLAAAFHFIMSLKFLCAALCFAVMLEKVWPQVETRSKALFAVSYPFIGYMTFYIWNISWMDGVVLLPLVALGVWQIIRERRPLMYILALAAALISNYYIGYMLAAASVLFFLCGAGLFFRKADMAVLRATGWFVLSAAAAAALAAVVLLPAYAALPADRAKTFSELWENLSWTSTPREILSMLFTDPLEGMHYPNNYPVIFTGIVQLVLVVLFFLNREIPRRQKAAGAVLLFAFGLSFCISILNVIWHGFSENRWFNFRYSFLASFVLELLAFISFIHLKSSRQQILACGAILAALAAFALGTSDQNIGVKAAFFDAAAVLAVLFVFTLLAGKEKVSRFRQTALFAGAAAITLSSLLAGAYFTLERLPQLSQNDEDRVSISEYESAVLTEQKTEELIGDDGSFYRRGSTKRYGRNDPMLFGYAGVEEYASTESAEALEAADRLGVKQTWTWSRYDDNVPIASDALLAIRYVSTGETFKDAWYDALGTVPETDLTVYENPYALPVLYAGESVYSSQGAGKFDYMNGSWNAVSTAGGDVFVPVETNVETAGTEIRVSFRTQEPGPVYAFIPEGFSSVEVPLKSYDQDVFFVGDFAGGQDGELIVQTDGTYGHAGEIALYTERLNVLAAKSQEAQAAGLETENVSGSEFKVRYELPEDGLIMSSIPYDEGWHAYVDGEEVEVFRNMDAFLSFGAPRGEHEVRLVYWPPLFAAGAVISAAALAAVVWLGFWLRRHPAGSDPALAALS